ncbi:hypothetical protein OCS_04106 [Ophiocordyceps sinensis CO18]|nr:hypothetical protein OCS_04106 [Ophiocordyceps sinensis CO18]
MGLLTLSDGKNVYTDVHLFCERLQSYSDENKYALCSHYMSFLAGGALNWYMSELNAVQRKNLATSSLERFCRKLIKRFQRPLAEVSKELHGEEYTISMWNAGMLSLP